jgi:hypothetical protein
LANPISDIDRVAEQTVDIPGAVAAHQPAGHGLPSLLELVEDVVAIHNATIQAPSWKKRKHEVNRLIPALETLFFTTTQCLGMQVVRKDYIALNLRIFSKTAQAKSTSRTKTSATGLQYDHTIQVYVYGECFIRSNWSNHESL